ncbi:pyrimidine utilization flavin reductase protein F [Acinetobacter sp. S40]|uniref:NADH-dependent FMN reductase RutF n=1 Tax=unclassified Acinetobacter TaxID=196816 RepID=UPI00190BE55E|nr:MULTISPECIES: pyrimidine utilization flavin reductase protein F [unclassified Acinetobacter]MBJ9986139.1 pyrimidine utilization flavin reductase protein F [Acinetobacter sp. S40]MBK0064311.1 pyrimidine utilization flavin reductase protein F [Acinetobacter sp. S55]MBK0067697.1 pyrimidine utilization flavin reductase protein F [Acinetobacter sp. S54]
MTALIQTPNQLKSLLEQITPSNRFTSMQVDQHIFRQGMSNLGAAVNVITTDGMAGKSGFTASAVCSVTDSPPTLLVCLNRAASVFETFQKNQVLCVNTLAAHQATLSNIFGGKTPMDERFTYGTWQTLATQAPVLEDALVSFDCEVVQSLSVGSHDVFFCQVKAIQYGQGQNPLMYFNRNYCEPHYVA